MVTSDSGLSTRGGARATQQLRAEATRAALLAAGRSLFAEVGYHAAGTNDVVQRARVTRGALYHHFASKEELFEAVFRQLLDELHRGARDTVVALSGDTWKQLVEAFKAYLQLIAGSAEVQRIVLVDAPAVFGWRRWRELQSEWVAAGTAKTLEMLMDQGVVAPGPPGPLANLIQAALNDAAFSIANADDPRLASVEVSDALLRLVEGLRCAEA